MMAMAVGGMGAKDRNYHKQAMVDRGFGDAANRIQELFLAGRREEAIAAVPDEYLDVGALIGPPARIRQRFATWRDAGFTLLLINEPTEEAMDLIAGIAQA